MKKLVLAILIITISCKSDKKENVDQTNKTEPSILEKIAETYGFEHWKDVSQIEFTFNIDRDSSHFERSWAWNPKTSDVTLISNVDTISYNRKKIDSLSLDADKKFINDKYWLLVPFQLIWNQGITVSEVTKEESPINKTLLNKITVTYPNNGGYTPGDAYDLFFDNRFLIKEWIYRHQNQKEPSLVTTWEDQQNFNGIKLALKHTKPEGHFKLYFSNVKVTLI